MKTSVAPLWFTGSRTEGATVNMAAERPPKRRGSESDGEEVKEQSGRLPFEAGPPLPFALAKRSKDAISTGGKLQRIRWLSTIVDRIRAILSPTDHPAGHPMPNEDDLLSMKELLEGIASTAESVMADLTSTKERKAKLEQAVRDAEGKQLALEEQKRERDQRIKRLEEELQQLAKDAEAREGDAGRRITELTAEVQRLRLGIVAAEAFVKRRDAKWEAEIEAERERTKDLEAQLQGAKVEVEELSARKNDAESTVSDLRKKLRAEEVSALAKEDEIGTLKDEIERLKERIRDLNADIKDARTNLLRERGENIAAEEASLELASRLGTAEEATRLQESLRRTAEAKAEQLLLENKQRAEQIAQLQQQHDQIKDELAHQYDEIAEKDGEVRERDEEIKALQAENQRLRDIIDGGQAVDIDAVAPSGQLQRPPPEDLGGAMERANMEEEAANGAAVDSGDDESESSGVTTRSRATEEDRSKRAKQDPSAELKSFEPPDPSPTNPPSAKKRPAGSPLKRENPGDSALPGGPPGGLPVRPPEELPGRQPERLPVQVKTEPLDLPLPPAQMPPDPSVPLTLMPPEDPEAKQIEIFSPENQGYFNLGTEGDLSNFIGVDERAARLFKVFIRNWIGNEGPLRARMDRLGPYCAVLRGGYMEQGPEDLDTELVDRLRTAAGERGTLAARPAAPTGTRGFVKTRDALVLQPPTPLTAAEVGSIGLRLTRSQR